jgi:hypothetical protein
MGRQPVLRRKNKILYSFDTENRALARRYNIYHNQGLLLFFFSSLFRVW